MKNMTRFVFATLALALGSTGWGQGVFNKYAPQPGIQVSTGVDYHNTAATSSDVIGLWSGCTGSNFLRGDGTCTVPAGTGVSSVTVPAPLTATSCTGGACAITWTAAQTANRFLATPDGTTGAVSLRAMVAGDVPPINLGSTANGGVSSATILLGTNGGTSNGFFSVTGPTTTLRTFTFPNASATVLTTNAAVTVAQGGTGVATLTNHGVLLGQGASNVSAVAAMAADTLLQGQGTGADPAAVAVNNCGSGTTALSYSTSTHTFGCQTISVGGSGTVTSVTAGAGLAASPNPIVSTGTMTLDLTAANTWTGNQTFRGASVCENNSGAGSFTQCVLNTSSGSTVSNYLSFNSLGTLKGVLLNERVAGGNCSGDALDDMCLRSISGDVYVSGATRLGYAAAEIKGTFTGTLTGFGSGPSGTFNYARSGNIACIYTTADVTGTSNANTMTLTGVPAAVRPANNRVVALGNMQDNSVGNQTMGQGTISSAGVVTLAKLTTSAASSSNWTASGTKGVNAGWEMCYSAD